jgi:hypothetical protein
MDSAAPLDSKVPLHHWLELNDYDRHRYNELRLFFRQQQKDCLRERRTSPFPAEITSILAFTDQATPGRDSRCIVAGIACSGPYIAVNTQQFKHLVGRCKSSINGGFQQIGYDVVRNRAAARERITQIVPALRVESLRQWTVRCAGDDASVCFYSPSVLAEVATGERIVPIDDGIIPTAPEPPGRQVIVAEPIRAVAPPKPRPAFEFADEGESWFGEMQPSFSVGFLADLEKAFDLQFGRPGIEGLPPWNGNGEMQRSQSVDIRLRFP